MPRGHNFHLCVPTVPYSIPPTVCTQSMLDIVMKDGRMALPTLSLLNQHETRKRIWPSLWDCSNGVTPSQSRERNHNWPYPAFPQPGWSHHYVWRTTAVQGPRKTLASQRRVSSSLGIGEISLKESPSISPLDTRHTFRVETLERTSSQHLLLLMLCTQ